MARAGAVVLLAVALDAQPFWEKKPFAEWSKGDCERLLRDSPWASSYAFSRMAMAPIQQDRAPGDDRARENTSEVRYNVQLRSALPVRQAMVRLTQLSSAYQKLAPEQKKVTDQDAEKLLAETFADVILVHVEYYTNIQGYEQTLNRQWQSRSVADLANNTFLIGARGGRISPAKFRPGAGEFDLTFPRLVDGEPLLNARDKSLKVEFPHPAVGDVPGGRVVVEFRVNRMTVGGQVLY
jgi:hypothetical protein